MIDVIRNFEKWKQIENLPNHFISNWGRVRHDGYTVRSKGGIRFIKPNLLKNSIDKDGYLFFGDNLKIHLLVLVAFVGPKPTHLHTGNHIDGNKSNNRPYNLEWATRSEQIQHAYDVGLIPDRSGENNPCAKLNNQIVSKIRFEYSKGIITYRQLSIKYKVAISRISDIINYKTWI